MRSNRRPLRIILIAALVTLVLAWGSLLWFARTEYRLVTQVASRGGPQVADVFDYRCPKGERTFVFLRPEEIPAQMDNGAPSGVAVIDLSPRSEVRLTWLDEHTLDIGALGTPTARRIVVNEEGAYWAEIPVALAAERFAWEDVSILFHRVP